MSPAGSWLAQQREQRIRARRRERLGPGWAALQAQVLSEAPTCSRCPAPSTEVDHIVPLGRGGSSDRTNLQALCRQCHASKTVTESAAPLPRSTEVINRARAGVRLYSSGPSASGRYPTKGRALTICSAEELEFYGVYMPPGEVKRLEDRSDIVSRGRSAGPKPH